MLENEEGTETEEEGAGEATEGGNELEDMAAGDVESAPEEAVASEPGNLPYVGLIVQYKESEKEIDGEAHQEHVAALVVFVHDTEDRNCCVNLRVFPGNGETPYPKTGVVMGLEVGNFRPCQ